MNELRQKAYHPENLNRSSKELIDAACEETVNATQRHFGRLSGKTFRTCIPAQHDDSDVLIMDALRRGADLLDELEDLRRENAALVKAVKAMLNVVRWMSGSEDFSPDGLARRGWLSWQDDVKKAAALVAKHHERAEKS